MRNRRCPNCRRCMVYLENDVWKCRSCGAIRTKEPAYDVDEAFAKAGLV